MTDQRSLWAAVVTVTCLLAPTSVYCGENATPSITTMQPSAADGAAKASTPQILVESFGGMPQMSPTNNYLARYLLDSPAELERALRRAEKLFDDGAVTSADQPVAFVIHGPEAHVFLRENYREYKAIVDLAAKLSAFRVVDVRVCETRLNALGETPSALPPFVETVPFGPAEIERLVEREDYLYF